MRSPDWARLHARQVQLASGLETALPEALAVPDLASRTDALAQALENAGASGIQKSNNGAGVRLASPIDPTPVLLDALLGRNEEESAGTFAVKVLAT